MVNEQFSEQSQLAEETKQARRERRRAKEKTRISQHGKNLARVYKDTVSKRTKTKKAFKQTG
ncbi:MAG: hypothetical protein J7L92_05145 [Dehalococcoidia bacterium]|nr:hypothetical protein [Dehalococcoidia bacterium]